eukprot:3523386-Alexandrium_andersonii.AAC.1
MKEDPKLVSSLSRMMGPAITVAVCSTMPERPASETAIERSDTVEVVHANIGGKKPHPFPIDRIRAVLNAANSQSIAECP